MNNAANGAHFSTLTLSLSRYSGTDLNFGFAAVLENPTNPHTEEKPPKFSFNLVDNTTNTSLYSISFDSRNATSNGITWHAGLNVPGNTSTWMFSGWNVVPIFRRKSAEKRLFSAGEGSRCDPSGISGKASTLTSEAPE